MIAESAVWPLMMELAECLCAEVTLAHTDDDPEVCFCGVLPGTGVLAEYAGEGMMAWVRLDNAYPTDSFPDPADSASCATYWAYVIELGVMECIPAFMDSTGALPTAEDQLYFTQRQMAGLRVLRRAVECCLEKRGIDSDYVLGGYAPIGPAGGTYGGSLDVTVLGG